MEAIISQALEDASAAASKGSENTPFVLRRIRELTNNGSVVVNQALIESNVVCAAKIATAMANMDSQLRSSLTASQR